MNRTSRLFLPYAADAGFSLATSRTPAASSFTLRSRSRPASSRRRFSSEGGCRGFGRRNPRVFPLCVVRQRVGLRGTRFPCEGGYLPMCPYALQPSHRVFSLPRFVRSCPSSASPLDRLFPCTIHRGRLRPREFSSIVDSTWFN